MTNKCRHFLVPSGIEDMGYHMISIILDINYNHKVYLLDALLLPCICHTATMHYWFNVQYINFGLNLEFFVGSFIVWGRIHQIMIWSSYQQKAGSETYNICQVASRNQLGFAISWSMVSPFNRLTSCTSWSCFLIINMNSYKSMCTYVL